MYDGRVGRWMTTDPYSQYHSPYLAMGNNPVKMIDPDGGLDEFTAVHTDAGWEYTKISDLGGDEFDIIHYGSFNENGSFSGQTIYDSAPLGNRAYEMHSQRGFYGRSDAIQSTDNPIEWAIGLSLKGTWALFKGGYKLLTSPKMAKSLWNFSDNALSKTAAATIKGGAMATIKSSKFGSKIADVVPTNGVPKNWGKEQIGDAIIDYQTSIISRKKELAHFMKNNKGDAIGHKLHAQRITQEENLLRSLQKAFQ